ncbi:ATPase, putative [Bodo saltans]|uniref:ATPase, putative n=1 Tax=Bodo saltans TaxID=75058 RepID=A0A0S4IHA2_BODSA|nr:ATPase, putative [Bodo saltans]|eukprot:CUE62893.1 ATPase, putative [Bodo saltans]
MRLMGLHLFFLTFYMRKGADILSKWVGESEKQLRLLFDEARKHQPSIIFFDEIDGLAPVRHSKQEQTHAALVSTLLAMMDGLDDRGQVIIIGATNRPDTIDPALRRPGRFDRELRFPVPDEAARRHIINIHTNKMSIGGRTDERDRVAGALLKASEGWTGADIQACCTEATLHALRTKLPQIFVSNKRLKIPANDLVIHVSEGDVHAASMKLAPSLRRAAASAASNSGGAYVPSILEHMDLLVRTPVLRLAESIEKTFHPAMELARQSSRTTDTSDLLAAIRTMNAAPLPHIPRGALSIVVDDNPNRSTFGATEVVKGLAKHYSSLPAVHISLPLLLRGTVSVQLTDPKKGPAAYDGGGDDDVASRRSYATEHASTPSDLFSSLRNLAPCVAYFHEADAWLEAHSDVPLGGESKTARPHDANEEEEEPMDEHLSIWRSELLATLQSADVLVVLPLARDRVVQLEASLIGIPLLARLQSSLLMSDVVHTNATPEHADLNRWVSYLWGCAEAVQYAVAQKTTSLAEYPEDDSPPPPLSPRTRHAEHAQQKVLWQRVEYKRRQLRHLLAQWLSQFIAGRRFQILLSADLDLTEDSPQWADWQRHVRGRRVGLQDIMEKLENEEYNCLSQYVGDVEQLCSNVRTFFVTRSLADQRYRHRAMELKETTVLNMYKIHKNVTSFCEENKDMNEPISSDDDDEEEESTEIANQKAVAGSGSHDTVKALPTSTVVPKKKKKKNTGTFGRSRRKKKSVKKAPPPKSASPNTTKDHHDSNDEETTDEEEGHDASSVSPQNAGNKESAIVIDDTPDASPLGKAKVRASTDGGEEKEAPHASPQVRPAATTSSAGGSPQSNASSSVYGNIGSLSSSRDSSSGDQMDNSAATALSSQAAPPRQLFPVVVSTGSDVKRLPPNPEALSGEQLRQWSSLASRSLTLEELHLVTFHVLRALDAWRWEGNTAAASTTSTSQRWEVRFASIWEIAVRAASPP